MESLLDWDPVDIPKLGAASMSDAKVLLAAGVLALPRYPDLKPELPINLTRNKIG